MITKCCCVLCCANMSCFSSILTNQLMNTVCCQKKQPGLLVTIGNHSNYSGP